MTKVLLTGGSGFIAAHCLEQLLAQGHNVVTTVRSEDKAQKIRDTHKDQASRLEVVVVPDIAKEDAFDEVVKTPDLEVVLHTASPFHFNWTDPEKELINPAVVGTTGILRAIQRSAPSLRRVVITSSFASILDESKLTDPNHTFTEASWNPSTKDDIHRSKPTAYRVSKTLAEQSAWAFVRDQKPGFDLVTVCPPLVLGPVAHHLPSLDAINESNARVVRLLRGEWKDEIPSQGPVSIWVDVRDVARAHILAMDKPELGGKRLFTTPGYFSNAEIAAIVRDRFPEYKDKLPGPEVKGGERPEADKTFKWDVSATDKLLGIEWIGLDKSISDLVTSLKAFGI